MNKYTLDEIAYVDRCLFPDNLIEELEDVGFKDAYIYRAFFRNLAKENRMSVVVLYQEFIPTEQNSDSSFVEALEKVIQKILKKNNS